MNNNNVVTKQDWKNLRIGYRESEVIQLVDRFFGYKEKRKKK